MEKPLDRQLEEIMNVPGVTGVLCADTLGFCLGARGLVEKDHAGLVSNLASDAARLNPTAAHSPVISIESDSGTVLIKSHDKITMAIYKGPS